MSNNKQSSIELFIEQLEEKGGAWENVSIRRLNISIDVSDYMELKQQAKAMHKEEIINSMSIAFMDGAKIGAINYTSPYKDWEQYYNETFNTINNNK